VWVVKLGGSLLCTPELNTWLGMLVHQSNGRVVIVPGGGPFADAVRAAQDSAGFDDAAAHHMALLAMEQFGLVMKSLHPALVTAASELEIAERSWQHRAIVWLPSQMVLADETIAQSWDVTSDSLAVWLAVKIGAERLVLVKQADVAENSLAAHRLVAEGVLDAAFADFAAGLSCPVHIVGKSEHAAFAAALTGGPLPALAF
jgi:aspartokinase-like uncharacterized kinase